MSTKTRKSRVNRMFRLCLLCTLMLPLLSACAPPPQDPVSGVMCDWITYIKTIGMSLGTIGLFISFMIVVISYSGPGTFWAGLYHLAQQLVNGAVVAVILLAVGMPAFWWIMESVGANTCAA